MRIASLLLTLVVCAWLASLGLATPHIDADPNRAYPVTPEAGKWMILAAHFSGDESADLARQLAAKIRARDNYPAYTFSRSNELRRQRDEETNRLREMYPDLPKRRPRVRIEEEWAVLIGGWPDFDSACNALTKIKKLPIHDLKTTTGRVAYEVLMITDEERQKGKTQAVILNPLVNAIVCRNPTVPADPKPAQSFDPLWEKLNAEEDYSLLKNPKVWTLVVKEYQGGSILQSPTAKSSGFLDKIWGTNKPTEGLNAAAAQAHEVARVLRKLKFDAWVMHTRTSSFVTVGSFDSKDDPNLQRMAVQITKLKLGPVDFMAHPLPAEVPRPGK